MNTIKQAVLAFSCICLLSIILIAQAYPDKFISGKGNFSIVGYGNPTEQKTVGTTLGDFELTGESVVWKLEDGTFLSIENFIVYGEKPTLSPAEKTAAALAYKNATIEQFKKLNIALSESPYIFEGFKGFEIRGVSAGKLVVRIFFGKNRLYSISVVRRNEPGFGSQIKTLNSFRLLTKDEYISARIAENTPAELPQAPVPKRPVSDLAENNLKGKIKEITEDYQETPKAARIRWSEEKYNENGNLTNEIGFMEGYPDSIRSWGWIEEKRVNRENNVEYAVGDRPRTEIIVSMDEAPMMAGSETVVQADERFDNRYELKYNTDGQQIEKQVFSNTGRLLTIQTILYSPNRRETIFRSGAGEFYNKTINLLDAAGNIIEERQCDENAKRCSIQIYKYDFDESGNWIVKKIFERKTIKGRVTLKPAGSHFRTIAYYK